MCEIFSPVNEQLKKRKRQKAMGLDEQTCITHFCTFLCRRCTSTTWTLPFSRFIEDVNTRQQFTFSFAQLKYSPLEFNSSKNHLSLSHCTRWNKCDKFWSNANSRGKKEDLFSSVATVPQMESSGISSGVGEIRQTKRTKRVIGLMRLGILCQLLQWSRCRTRWGERFSRLWVQQQRRFSWCLEVEFLWALERTMHV